MTTKEKKVIAVFTENDYDRQRLCQVIEEYFPAELTPAPVNIATHQIFSAPPKAVLVNMTSRAVASKYFPHSQIIYAQRFINGNNLEQLIQLPPGKSVLVVNKPRAIAEEMLADLLTLGVNHLNLTPYWPGAELDTSAFDTAVYAGFLTYCPENMKQYINVGYRSVSPSTLAEIAKLYDLPTTPIDAAQVRFGKTVVNGLYNTQAAHQETRTLKRVFEQVCKLSANGILTLDPDDTVNVVNPAAEQLLGVSETALRGQHYRLSLASFKQLRRLLEPGEECREELIYIRKMPVLATLEHTIIGGRRHTVISLIPVDALQSTEEKARSTMHNRGFNAKYQFSDIEGRSAALQRALTIARYYAASDATVLITGESGTGKELFAQSIHNRSPRAKGPFVGVNFAAIPENLIESELFGYEEGAFTGAVKGGKQGLFRSAYKGTIFLDEIGDVSPSMQSRLLRVLEEREIMPVGSSRVIPVDVRIICATNKDLLAMVQEGSFREDLYYRLKVFQLEIPPLRERKEDIPGLLESLSGVAVPPALTARFLAYHWPGNIRELKAIAQHLALFHAIPASEATHQQIWEEILDTFFDQPPAAAMPAASAPPPIQPAASPLAPAQPASPGSPPSMPQPTLPAADLLLLRLIHQANQQNCSVGRYSLAKAPELIACGLTEARIKRKLDQLKKAGYLTAGRTKQGVMVTAQGAALLSALIADQSPR